MKDKWFWFVVWPLVTGALVGFGMLGPGAHPWIGWDNAIAGGSVVLMAVACGTLLGLRIRASVTDSLTQWATSAQALYDQEAESHERTADVLFELAYGVTSAAAAQQYLIDLDSDDDEEDEDEPTEETH